MVLPSTGFVSVAFLVTFGTCFNRNAPFLVMCHVTRNGALRLQRVSDVVEFGFYVIRSCISSLPGFISNVAVISVKKVIAGTIACTPMVY